MAVGLSDGFLLGLIESYSVFSVRISVGVGSGSIRFIAYSIKSEARAADFLEVR